MPIDARTQPGVVVPCPTHVFFHTDHLPLLPAWLKSICERPLDLTGIEQTSNETAERFRQQRMHKAMLPRTARSVEAVEDRNDAF